MAVARLVDGLGRLQARRLQRERIIHSTKCRWRVGLATSMGSTNIRPAPYGQCQEGEGNEKQDRWFCHGSCRLQCERRQLSLDAEGKVIEVHSIERDREIG